MWAEISEDGYFIQELPIDPSTFVPDEMLKRYIELPDKQIERAKEYSHFGPIQIDVNTKKLIVTKLLKRSKKRFERKFKQELTQIKYKGVEVTPAPESVGVLAGYIFADVYPIYWQGINFTFVELTNSKEATELLKMLVESLNSLFKQQMKESEEEDE